MGLNNPHIEEVKYAVRTYMRTADYTLTIFTGHGYINQEKKTCLEVMDGDIMVKDLKPPDVTCQAIIIDACREKYIESPIVAENRTFSKMVESTLGIGSKRYIFDILTLSAPEGVSILYAASENQSSLDTDEGGAYLLSLLKITEHWRDTNDCDLALSLKEAHLLAAEYLEENFEDTIQTPKMLPQKRTIYFPFAVKNVPLYG
ncbi:MAG TPA: caspase family protein [Puia sp.]